MSRLLCLLGLHRWSYHDERLQTAVLTYARCRREGCRYGADMIVNVERIRSSACTCRKGAWSPSCPRHGREAVA